MGPNFYNLLNLGLDATPEDIRSAYFEAAKKYHPDTNKDADANRQFILIQEAYDILSNPARREIYDGSLSSKEKENPRVKLEITYSEPSLLPREEEQLLYVLVELTGEPLRDEVKLPPLHICLIVDRSNSMRGRRLEMVLANVRHLLQKLLPEDLISIVAFSDRAEVIVPPTAPSKVYEIERAVSQIAAGGATEIYHGLQAGIDLIKTISPMDRLEQLILITDGHTYGDEAACLKLAEDARKQGVAINALGIGSEWNDSFLDRLASLSGGNAAYVRDPDYLSRLIEEKVRFLNFMYARQVDLSYRLGEGIELMYAFRIYPETTPLEISDPLVLGNIEFGRKTSIILEFKIDLRSDANAELSIADGSILMDIPSRAIHKTKLDFSLRRVISATKSREPTPESILRAMSNLTLYRMQEKAKEDVANGNIQKATRRLENLASHLLAQGDREFAQSVLLEVDHIQRTNQFSAEGDKKIKYGTRSLLMLPAPNQPQS